MFSITQRRLTWTPGCGTIMGAEVSPLGLGASASDGKIMKKFIAWTLLAPVILLVAACMIPTIPLLAIGWAYGVVTNDSNFYFKD